MKSNPGSSPLARGTRRNLGKSESRQGLIPARAGNTGLEIANVPWAGAHPRSRGEHRSPQNRVCRQTGSSPLARGTRGLRAGSDRAMGLIPARAGNTWQVVSRFLSTGAHPRSRGEHEVFLLLNWFFAGSSPLARGTRCGGQAKASRLGLIPARAGNTVDEPDSRYVRRAHPRSRGEHNDVWADVYLMPGSSPLARGTLIWIWIC